MTIEKAQLRQPFTQKDNAEIRKRLASVIRRGGGNFIELGKKLNTAWTFRERERDQSHPWKK